MNVSDMVENELKRCVWKLRTCLQMHSCIPLNPHPPMVFISSRLRYRFEIIIYGKHETLHANIWKGY